jgi:diguanylate cyclase (GGDEF)-like protein
MTMKKRSQICIVVMIAVLLASTVLFIVHFQVLRNLNDKKERLIVTGGSAVEIRMVENELQRVENTVVVAAIIGINLFLVNAVLAFVFHRSSVKGDKTTEIMKSSMQICIISMVALFIAGSVYLGIKFFRLNEKHIEYTNMIQSGISPADPELVQFAEEISRGERRVFIFAVILAAIVVGDSIVAFIFTRVRLNQTRAMVYKIAYEDEVTGLPTKAKHRSDLEEFFKKPRSPRAYVSLDIYNFKYINEMYGYVFGNYVLRYVADEIRKTLKSDELFARTGGSHFGLLLRYDTDEALRDRILDWYEKIGKVRTKERANVVNIQFTAGVYKIMDKTVDPVRARECANVARENAPHHYDNTIEFYDTKLQEQQASRAEMEFESSKALEDNEFVVFLQPKYSTSSEKIVGAEALIRWKHHSKGLIPPNDFVPLFESNGFIVKIDFFVLEEVCKCIKKWIEDGVEPVVVSVNLSRVHLYDGNLVEQLVSIVDKYDVPHNLIEFELTETVLFEELEYLIEVMNKLKSAGFILSMDDFGSGYSSLNMLKRLPVDVLKLDKGFMDNFRSDEPDGRDKAIISHVILMAKDLNMEVLAEGVETEMQQKFLKDSECDMIQGYYYSKPISIADFDLLFRGRQKFAQER